MWVSKSYNPSSSPIYVYEWKQLVEKGKYVINFIVTPTLHAKAVNLTAYNSSSGTGQTFTTFPETIDSVFLKSGTMTFTLSLNDNNFEFPSPQFFSVLSSQSFTEKGIVSNQNILKQYVKPTPVHRCHPTEDQFAEIIKFEALHMNCLLIYKKMEFIVSLLDLINKATIPEIVVNIQFSVNEEISVYILEMKVHYDFLRHFLSVTPSTTMPSSFIVHALLDPRFDNWIQSILATHSKLTLEFLQNETFAALIHNVYTYISTLMSRLSSEILKIEER